MAEWEEFKYAPEWQGSLPGRSFEKQTEDAINNLARYADERIVEAISSAAHISPYNGTPSDLGTPTPGISPEYARGDHRHRPPDSVARATVAERLDPGFRIELGGIATGAAESVDGTGTVVLPVSIPPATDETSGLMTPEDKAAIAAVAPYPRVTEAAVSKSQDVPSGADTSVDLSSSMPARLSIDAGYGLKADLDAGELNGVQEVTVKLGFDESAVASGEQAGLMGAEDKAALTALNANAGQYVVGVSQQPGAIVFTRQDGTQQTVETGAGGEGNLTDVTAEFDYSPTMPEKFPSQNQRVVITGGGAILANATPTLRANVRFSLPVSTDGVSASEGPDLTVLTLEVYALPFSAEGMSAGRLVGAGLNIVASTLAEDGAEQTYNDIGMQFLPDGEETWGAVTYEYGTFVLTWTREELHHYTATIAWMPPSSVYSQVGQTISVEASAGGASATAQGAGRLSALQPSIEAFIDTTAINAPDAEEDAATLQLSFTAVPGAAEGVSSVALVGDGLSIPAADLAEVGATASYSDLLLRITPAEEGEEPRDTDEYGTFSVTWERLEPEEGHLFAYKATLSWTLPEGAYLTEPGALLVLTETRGDGSTEEADVDMSSMAQGIFDAASTAGRALEVAEAASSTAADAIVSIDLATAAYTDPLVSRLKGLLSVVDTATGTELCFNATELPAPEDGTPVDKQANQFSVQGSPEIAVYAAMGEIPNARGAIRIKAAGSYCSAIGVPSLPAVGGHVDVPLSGTNADGSSFTLRISREEGSSNGSYLVELLWTPVAGSEVVDGLSVLPAYVAIQSVVTDGGETTTSELIFGDAGDLPADGTPASIGIISYFGAPANLEVYALLGKLPNEGESIIKSIPDYASWTVSGAYDASDPGTYPSTTPVGEAYPKRSYGDKTAGADGTKLELLLRASDRTDEDVPGTVGYDALLAWTPGTDADGISGGDKHAEITVTTTTASGASSTQTVDIAKLISYIVS